nr:hypothetical protein [uncultured Noviherbaspirillum sp.]
MASSTGAHVKNRVKSKSNGNGNCRYAEPQPQRQLSLRGTATATATVAARNIRYNCRCAEAVLQVKASMKMLWRIN